MRWVGATAKHTLGALVFVLALLAAVPMHLGVPVVRRLVAARVNALLAEVFQGRLVIENLGGVGLTGIDGADVDVYDPGGTRVVRVEGLHARIDTVDLLRSLREGQELRIAITDVQARTVDVGLDFDPSGGPRIAKAFTPRPGTPTPPGSPPTAPQRVMLRMPRIAFDHVTVHGQPPGAFPIDGTVDHLVVALTVDPDLVHLTLTQADVDDHGLPGGLEARGAVTGELKLPLPDVAALAAHATWCGQVGPVNETVDATYAAGSVDASVDVPPVSPDALRTLWPACPLTAPGGASARVTGAFPTFFASLRAATGKGSVAVDGPVLFGSGGEIRAIALVSASHVDLADLDTAAPNTDLSAEGDVLVGGGPQGAAGALALLSLAPGLVGPTRLPGATIAADVARDGPTSPVRAHASLTIREAGAPTSVRAELTPKGTSYLVSFDATTDVPRLDRIARAPTGVQGRAHAHAHGTIDLAAGRIDASADVGASGIATGPLSLGDATARARVAGPLAAPTVDAELEGSELRVGGLRFAEIEGHSRGPAANQAVELRLRGRGPLLVARAALSLGGGADLRDIEVYTEIHGDRARLRAAHMGIDGPRITVEDATVEGLGAPLHGSLTSAPGLLQLSARSHGIDLARLAHFAGEDGFSEGQIAIDANATIRSRSAQGHIAVDVTKASAGPLQDAEAHVDVTLDGRKITGTVSARLADIASADVKATSVTLGGDDALQASTWRTASGAASVDAHVDLAKAAALVPASLLPAKRVSGSIDLTGHVGRDSPTDDTPDIDLTATTHGLVAANAFGASWTLKGLDAQVELKVDGGTGFTSLDAAASDAKGTLVSVDATSSTVPWATLLAPNPPLGDLALQTPITCAVTIPDRDVASLPSFLGTKGLRGTIAARVDWKGAATSPTIDAHASITHGRADVAILSLPVDLDLTGHYDGTAVDATLKATARSAQVLAATTHVTARATDVLAGLRGAPVPWKADGQVQLAGFPLQSLAVLDDRQVRGTASGQVTLQGLHDDARATASLALADLSVADIPCKDAQVQATLDGTTLQGSARVDQTDGYLSLQAHAGARWGAAMAPSLDVGQPIEMTIDAKQFRAALLLPFLQSVFTELDGRVDATAGLQVDAGGKVLRPQGTIRLTDGVFEVGVVGGEFHDATAEIDLTPDGVVQLKNVTAKGLSGEIDAAATARFNGLAFGGANGVVQVDRKQPLPLVFEGTQVGNFYGRVEVAVSPLSRTKGLDVAISVPQTTLQLPLASANTVQALGPIAGVEIGTRAAAGGDFETAALDGPSRAPTAASAPGTPLRVSVKLGSSVEVKRSTDLDVWLEGEPTVAVAAGVHATGQVRLVRGLIDVQGKQFTIDNGTVTFVDDPTNPQVVLTASWVAPDGTTVYADFIGPLKTGKVTLRSDPAKSKNEILSLILFGTTDEQASAASGTSPQASSAVGAAGGAATAPINRALGGVNQMLDNFGLAGGISTRIDTSQATPRPEVELQIARSLSLQVAWVLGVPPPGSNPDSTLFTLDWRFLEHWSVETTVGDAGTSILDLVWQHKY